MATSKQIGITLFIIAMVITSSLIANCILAIELMFEKKENEKIMFSLKNTDTELTISNDSILYYKNKLKDCSRWIEIIENRSELVKATVYNSEKEQCNEDYLHTASMFKLDSTNQFKHKILAVSRDLLSKFPIGSKVTVTGTDYDGVWLVEDKMNKRFSKRIDLLINSDMKIGVWENVIIEMYYD